MYRLLSDTIEKYQWQAEIEREEGGLKASKGKKVSQKTGPNRCSAVLSTVIDELKNHFKDVMKKCRHIGNC